MANLLVIAAFLALSNLELRSIADLRAAYIDMTPLPRSAADIGKVVTANREENVLSTEALKTWCVAKPTTADSLLQLNIDFACSKVNCSVIEPRGECQLPDNLMNHASVAVNLYYHSFGRTELSCYFQSTGMVVIEDPSSGTCVYEGVAPVRDATPASIKIKKGKSRAFSATAIVLTMVCSITGCVLMAVAVYVMLWLCQTRTPVVEVTVHTCPSPMHTRPEPSAPPLPVYGSHYVLIA